MTDVEIYKKLIVEEFNLNTESEVNNSNNGIGYFKLKTTQEELEQIKNSVNINKPIFSNKDWNLVRHPLPWIVYLTNHPRYDSSILPKIPQYSFDAKDRIILNKGHLVAKNFKRYLVRDDKHVKFFDKNNIRNIILQFSNINSSTDGYRGQSYFETKVRNYLKNHENMYYKIVPKFLDEGDKVPVGCELIAFGEEAQVKDFNLEEKVPYHVFIPNVGTEKFWKDFEPPILSKSLANAQIER